MENRASLTRFAWLSIATALVTMGLKFGAYLLTGSVGLLSDALESGVNLTAAIIALGILTVSARPPDEEHAYGHSKAEFFASGAEGSLILVAAISIIITAGRRLLYPQPLEEIDLGLAISVVASLINLGTAQVLLRAGRRYNSITLEADARHLMTDVWTSAGVLVGLGAVILTGWQPLDPLVGLVVAGNIIWSGVALVRGSILGLMDTALPPADQEIIQQILDRYRQEGVEFHALRTRSAAARRFISLHVLAPGYWTLQQGHNLVERIEADIRSSPLQPVTVFTHLEPLEDSASWQDTGLDRQNL